MVMTGYIRTLVFLSVALTSLGCQAIDNPDAPDYLEAFRSEASSYTQAIYENAQTTADSMEAYRNYIDFLEGELERSASALESVLAGPEQEAFRKSQSAWQAYQEAEKGFISTVWTPQNFGSSSAMSRLAFYADVLRSRTELLLRYLQQF